MKIIWLEGWYLSFNVHYLLTTLNELQKNTPQITSRCFIDDWLTGMRKKNVFTLGHFCDLYDLLLIVKGPTPPDSKYNFSIYEKNTCDNNRLIF